MHHHGYWYGDKSDRADCLVTLCTRCHQPREHQPGGKLYGWKPTLKGFRAETFMTMIYQRLMVQTGAVETFGYITKARRIKLGLAKSHHNDAFVISGGTNQARCKPTKIEQIRRNNRSLEAFMTRNTGTSGMENALHHQSLLELFLNALRKEHVPVSIFLVNGIRLRGQIEAYDQHVVMLSNGVTQAVYQHAISSILPARPLTISQVSA